MTAGKQPAPADVKLKFQHHFLKSNKNVYIPYILEISGGTFSSYPVTMYVRAVRKPEAGAAPAARDQRESTTELAVRRCVLPDRKEPDDHRRCVRARSRAGAAARRVHAVHRDARAAAEGSQAAAQDGRAGAAADGARHEHGADDEQRHSGESARSRPGAADRPAAARAAVHDFRLPGDAVVRRADSAVRRADVRVFHLQ